jgi:hypothetical protein
MIERFLTESQVKQTEYIIINNNICRTANNINDELQRCINTNQLLNYNQYYDKNHRTKELKYKDCKKQEVKKEYNKDQHNSYNYK